MTDMRFGEASALKNPLANGLGASTVRSGSTLEVAAPAGRRWATGRKALGHCGATSQPRACGLRLKQGSTVRCRHADVWNSREIRIPHVSCGSRTGAVGAG